MNKCKLVRDSCSKVMKQAQHVQINQKSLEVFVENLDLEFKSGYDFKKYDEYSCHLVGN
jgi:hypothetical protein